MDIHAILKAQTDAAATSSKSLPLPLKRAAASANCYYDMYLINNVHDAASGIQPPLPQIIRYTNLDHITGFKYVLLKVLSD